MDLISATKSRVKSAADRTAKLALGPPYGGFGHFVNHGPRDVRRVALTFDDGPSQPCTDDLLEVLDRHGVKGTFFCVGVNVEHHPDTVRSMWSTGHVVANHSGTHTRKEGLKLGRSTAHITQGERAIVDVLGVRPRLYRPPWGWLTPWEGRRLAAEGYTIIGWDVYTLDWKWPELDGGVIAEKAAQDTRPGSIICMHDAKAWEPRWDKKETARAVDRLIPALRDQGYEFVTVADLLGIEPYQSELAARRNSR